MYHGIPTTAKADPMEGGAGMHCIWCGNVLYVDEIVPFLILSDQSFNSCARCALSHGVRIVGTAALMPQGESL